jgi:hypothetical protein
VSVVCPEESPNHVATDSGISQHFQGLRRAQNKIETNGSVVTTPQKSVDPTLNPITRRPGPGRGRPRKSQSGTSGQADGIQQQQPQVQQQAQVQLQASQMGVGASGPGPGPASMQSAAAAMGVPVGVPGSDPLAMASNGDDMEDQHANKRPRLEEPVQEALDDETVLALTANNTADNYPSPT